MTAAWSEIDAWRSIWEALAIVNGADPDVAVNGHRWLCRTMGWEHDHGEREGKGAEEYEHDRI